MTAVLVSTMKRTRTLSFNRSERLNAVSVELYQETFDALQQADADVEIRAIILTGVGRSFCVGADLKAHKSGCRTPEERLHYAYLGQQVCAQIQTMNTPVIAAVHGYALGAGAEIAVSADFLIMAAEAQMGFPEVSIGTFVGGGVTNRLPRLVGLRRATEMLVLGERFTGSQAVEWGLAYQAVPTDELLDSAGKLADCLAGKAPLALGRMKAALMRNDALDVVFKREPEELVALMDTRDWAEGVAAFAEQRTPIFEGK